MNARCKHVEQDGFHTCGSYAFNLEKDGIDQGDLCDHHYWQHRAEKAERELAQPAARPCRSCDGTGERYTGICETPTALCKPCNGTGVITAPQQKDTP